MYRLTEVDKAGNLLLQSLYWDSLHAGKIISKSMAVAMNEAVEKLRDYENTGLDPDEVEDLQRENEKLKDEVERLQIIFEGLRYDD